MLNKVKSFIKKFFKPAYRDFFIIKKYSFLNKFNLHIKSSDILLIRIDLIGDCVLFTNTMLAIKDFYKNRRLVCLCLEKSRPIFERLNIFDEIITVDFGPGAIDYKKLKKLIKKIRHKKFDIVLQPQASKLHLADILSVSAKANERFCIKPREGNCSKKWIDATNFIYTKMFDYRKGWLNELEYGKAFALGLGIKNFKIDLPFLPYKQNNYSKDKYFVIFPGGSIIQKFWEPGKYAEIINYILLKTNYKCVVLGTSNEKYLYDLIQKDVKSKDRLSNLMGKTTLDDVIDIIGNAQFIVSNDTSGAHISAATRTKCIVVVGGWHYNRFFPYKIENKDNIKYLPIVANAFMECYYCNWTWDNIRKVNTECMDLILKSRPCPCISKIGTDKLIFLIEKHILRYD